MKKGLFFLGAWIVPVLLLGELILRYRDSSSKDPLSKMQDSLVLSGPRSHIPSTSIKGYSVTRDGFRGGQMIRATSSECLKNHENLSLASCAIASLQANSKDANFTRILFLGGSTTFGIGADDQNTFPQRLSKLANDAKKSPKVISLNFGLGGQMSYQQLQLAQFVVAQSSSPEITVSLDGINEDYCFFKQAKFVQSANLHYFSTLTSPKVTKQLGESLLLNHAMYKLAQLIRKYTAGNSNSNRVDAGNLEIRRRASSCSILYISYLTQLRHLLDDNRKRSFQPVLIVVQQPHKGINNKNQNHGKLPFYREFYANVEDKLRQSSLNGKILLVKAYEYPFRNLHYADAQHLNAEGNLFLAKIIYKHLLNAGVF